MPKGDPRDPMRPDEIKVKFDALVGAIIGQKCDESAKIIMAKENDRDVSRLIGSLLK